VSRVRPAPAGRLTELPRRPLGSSGLEVTQLGFGGAPIGGLYKSVPQSQAHSALTSAWDLGIRYYDTAPHYGAGASERRLGDLLVSRPREQYVVSTKVGRLLTDPVGTASYPDGDSRPQEHFDFSRDGVLRSLEGSLHRLRVDHVDLVLLHDPDEHWREAIGSALPTLLELRSQQVVRAVGVGMNQSEMLARFVRESDLDVILVAGRYTLLDQSALDELLPTCLERQVSVVAGGVFNGGVLADPQRWPHYDYRTAGRDVFSRVAEIQAVCRHHGVTMAAAAIQFAAAHPAVACALVGARSAEELAEARRAITEPSPAPLWAELKRAHLVRMDAPIPAA
jgi:D-threo-aldose 1-dehydrogenase